MSAKAIREFDGKRMIARLLGEYSNGKHSYEDRVVQITSEVVAGGQKAWDAIAKANPWLLDTKLVVKPDQLIKRRGKAGLLKLNASWKQVQDWVMERINKEIKVEKVSGILNFFIVEPFVPHAQEDEYYMCIQSNRLGEEIFFYHEGGVDVGDVDAKALRLQVTINEQISAQAIVTKLLKQVPPARQPIVGSFIESLFKLYRDLNYTYMEINPLVVVGDRITPLDLAAKIDETARFLSGSKWGELEFPAPFGRPEFPEEAYIRDLDSRTGASLKLTILNHKGRVWTMVAGGGASVVYADTISDLGYASELANYGEYSGAPDEEVTFEYARTILSLMTRHPDPRGKVLIIGGGIANFTDVAQTFKGIIRALKDYQQLLREHNVSIWVRRAGPNYQEGLRLMRDLGNLINVDIHVYGPETHMTAVVPMALGLSKPPTKKADWDINTPDETSRVSGEGQPPEGLLTGEQVAEAEHAQEEAAMNPQTAELQRSSAVIQDGNLVRMTELTRAIVYGMQPRAVQGMLDFDYLCKREKPSVAALVFPFAGNHYMKFYWGANEVLIPVFQSFDEAVTKNPDTSVVVNFASFRSVYGSAFEILKHSKQIKTIAIIAEGVPESQTRLINLEADRLGVGIVGPATVGGIKPGCFRIGNTGGMLDNIIMSKLYRPGSVAYVSKSGGMSNELNNIIARNSDGVFEGVAIGGDRYPGSRFIDHLLRYEANPEVKLMVLLGEVGGTDEFEVVRAMKTGKLTKPVIAWCIGTCAKLFPFEVQFGHAGACANGDSETASAKNAALAAAGAYVPASFDQFGEKIKEVYEALIASGKLIPRPEPAVPKVPMDYTWAKSLGLVRKPASFISSICDDRGEELLYAGLPISKVFTEDIGVGGVVSLLWFRRRLPVYATKFIEMVLMVTADHGPAVSGAHNTIVTARAGKDLISSLVSGLLTIGPRFGGALDGAASMFSTALDSGLGPEAFVKKMRAEHKLIMGIGHRIKSLQNPDMRVSIIKEFAKKNFPATYVLDYALQVEQITTKKKSNLILNVDGCIACCFVDLLRNCGAFSRDEATELIDNGCLNGLFVLGRSIGFIGHYLDQKRLKQGLYRHPWDDISYLTDSQI